VLRPYPVEPSLIERPLCRRCQARMMLARIEPGPAGSVLHSNVPRANVSNRCRLRTQLSRAWWVG
jgi:hypothetical protein